MVNSFDDKCHEWFVHCIRQLGFNWNHFSKCQEGILNVYVESLA